MILLKFKKLKRYYHLYQQNDLFGGITLICVCGAFDSKRGRHKFIACKNHLELILLAWQNNKNQTQQKILPVLTVKIFVNIPIN